MIYKVNGYNNLPTYYVEQSVFDANSTYEFGTLIVGNKQDADAKLSELKKTVLEYEAVRFSVCATFVNGNDTTWREIQESDPEDTICKVFDTFTGQYTECATKTEALALNEQKKQSFLTSCGLDKVYELETLPTPFVANQVGSNPQPISSGTQTL